MTPLSGSNSRSRAEFLIGLRWSFESGLSGSVVGFDEQIPQHQSELCSGWRAWECWWRRDTAFLLWEGWSIETFLHIYCVGLRPQHDKPYRAPFMGLEGTIPFLRISVTKRLKLEFWICFSLQMDFYILMSIRFRTKLPDRDISSQNVLATQDPWCSLKRTMWLWTSEGWSPSICLRVHLFRFLLFFQRACLLISSLIII